MARETQRFWSTFDSEYANRASSQIEKRPSD
jgi:hypothetical protein